MRPIDADALIEDVNKVKYFRKIQARRIIDAQPTVDAVPVEFIKGEIKDNKGFYNSSLRRLLDVWAERKEENGK